MGGKQSTEPPYDLLHIPEHLEEAINDVEQTNQKLGKVLDKNIEGFRFIIMGSDIHEAALRSFWKFLVVFELWRV